MALSIGQALVDLATYRIIDGVPWDSVVVNLEAFGFNTNDTELQHAIEKLLNQGKTLGYQTEIPNLSHFAQVPGSSPVAIEAVELTP